MSGDRRSWEYSELESLSSDKFLEFLDDFPSGHESNDSDNDSDEESLERHATEEKLTDVDLDTNIDIADEASGEADDGWVSEDEVSLAYLKMKILKQDNSWRKVSRYSEPVQFSEDVGPDLAEHIETPVDVFLSLFSPALLEKIVFETNLYATQRYCGSGKLFTHTNIDEIKLFLAINILMGIKVLPSYKDYFFSNLTIRDNYISNLMSRDRFAWLLGHIHLNNNADQPKKCEQNYDKLYKVRPMLNYLSESMLNSYKPEELQAVDESMIRFKDRSSLRQYMPNKPMKRRYKGWLRANESGYVSEFQIYTGKVCDSFEKELGPRVVKDLTRNIVGKHHRVYFDNFFSSVSLMEDLLLDDIYACGTARKGRKEIPKDFMEDKYMQRGASDWKMRNNGVLALKWMDKKGILFLSNHHNPEDIVSVNRRQKNGILVAIPCPMVVRSYNMHMGYVDKFDMLKSCYEIDRKSHKWWHRIMWYFVDMSIVNFYIIFSKRSEEKTMDLKSYRLSVVAGLVGADAEIGAKKKSLKRMFSFRENVPQEKRYDLAAHMPVHSTSQRCALCSTATEPHRTEWSCSSCNVGLCLSDKKKIAIHNSYTLSPSGFAM